MDAAGQERLKAFFQNVILDPIEPDDPRYVDLWEGTGLLDDDPVTALADTIELTPGSSVQLLSGYRGSGKTTQLRRLKRRLEEIGYAVLHVDIEDYLNTAVPVDVTDFLIFLAGSFDEAMSIEFDLPPGDVRRGFWERIVDFVGRVRPSGFELSLPLTGAKLKADLKESTEFTTRLREAMAASLGTLVTEVRAFVAEAVKAILDARPDALAVVLLVDSVEHYRGTSTTETEVQASIERLFGNHAEKLQFDSLHVLYTVPPYLKVKVPNVASFYEPGAGLQIIPAVKVRDHAGEEYEQGLCALRDVIGRRGDWEWVLGPWDGGGMRRICLASGGHLRDLLRIMQEVLRRARRVDALPVGDEVVQSALDQMTREKLPIADTDAEWLWRIHEEHDSPLADMAMLPALARFLDTHLVLCYRNGKEWYDVHPLIEDDVRAQVERLRRRASS